MSPQGDRKRWRQWLGDPQTGGIWDDIIPLLASRQIWKGYVEIVRNNPSIQTPGNYHDWVARQYLVFEASGIRRQSEVSRTVISMARLLDRIAKAPQVISRSSFVELHGEEDQKLAEKWFDQIAGPGAQHLPDSVPATDLATLKRTVAPVVGFVNTRVAHWDQRGFNQALSFVQIDRSLDLLVDLFSKYRQILLGHAMATDVVMGAWQSIFERAWL